MVLNVINLSSMLYLYKTYRHIVIKQSKNPLKLTLYPQKMKLILWLFILFVAVSCSSQKLPVIICTDKASPREKLAAKELRRYIYLRTGSLPEIRMVSTIEGISERYILISSLQENEVIK